jgi:hypothetical protein
MESAETKQTQLAKDKVDSSGFGKKNLWHQMKPQKVALKTDE